MGAYALSSLVGCSLVCRDHAATRRDASGGDVGLADSPVFGDAVLGVNQVDLAVTDLVLEAALEPVLFGGAVLAGPGLELEVRQFPRVAADGERNEVVEFIVTDVGFIDPLLSQESPLDAVGVARGGSDSRGVAGDADGLG